MWEGRGRLFSARGQISGRADARRASLFALTPRDEFARFLDEQLMSAEERLGEADSGGISGEEIQVWLKRILRVRANCVFQARQGHRLRLQCIRPALPDSGAQLARIAHQ